MSRDKLDLPTSLADRWETIVSEATKHAFEKRRQMMTAVGERPYKGVKTDPVEMQVKYLHVREDPVALTELLRQNATVKPDGSVRVRKGFIRGMQEQEAKLTQPMRTEDGTGT